jgi:hypothetical protein
MKEMSQRRWRNVRDGQHARNVQFSSEYQLWIGPAS